MTARSKPEPRFGSEAGMRFAVIFLRLSGIPEFFAALNEMMPAENAQVIFDLRELDGHNPDTKAPSKKWLLENKSRIGQVTIVVPRAATILKIVAGVLSLASGVKMKVRDDLEGEGAHRPAPGHGEQRHREPVAEEQRRQDHHLLLERRAQGEQRAGGVGEGDALQHAGDADVEQPVHHPVEQARVGDAGDLSPRIEGEEVEQQPEEEDEPGAAQHLVHDRAVVVAAGPTCGEREVRRDADDEEEEGEDQVGRRPPVPGGVLERRVDVPPAAGVVDEQHRGDGHAAEDVERAEPFAGAGGGDGGERRRRDRAGRERARARCTRARCRGCRHVLRSSAAQFFGRL